MDYNTTKSEICQEEKLNKELEKKFTPKRKSAELLAQSYVRLGYDAKAERVGECGTELEFRKSEDSSDNWRLSNANFCRDRLCPMCSWRRSYKTFAQVSQVMDVIADKYAFIFLTLTVPNCAPDDLIKTIDGIQKGWHNLTQQKRFKSSVRGFFKALEVTRNADNGTYHPHLHNILAVDKHNYFNGKQYIKRDEWLSMWQKVMKDPTITQVDVRRCKAKDDIRDGMDAVKALGAAVAEVAKYSVKSSDYLIPGEYDLTDEIVFTLGAALHSRRLTAFGGVFDEVHKKLMLDDCENGDLINVDGSTMRSDVAVMIRKYGWGCGAYKLLEERREVNINVEVEDNEIS